MRRRLSTQSTTTTISFVPRIGFGNQHPIVDSGVGSSQWDYGQYVHVFRRSFDGPRQSE